MDLVDSSLTARSAPAPAAPSQTDTASQPPVTTRDAAPQGTTASASGITARAAANQGAAAPAIDPRQKQKGEAKTARIIHVRMARLLFDKTSRRVPSP